MEDVEAPYYDSMYEMDAPGLVDFDATDISVNESIFDQKIVGERSIRAFKDIGNVTPKWCKSASICMTSKTPLSVSSPLVRKTPQNESPAVAAVTRRVTRSAAREIQHKIAATLSPQCSTTAASPQLKSELVRSSPQKGPKEEVTSVKLEDKIACGDLLEAYPPPVEYNACSGTGSPVPTKPRMTRVSVKASPSREALQAPVEKGSGGKPLRSRMSSDGRRSQPAHSGTPFKGKRSPLKTLRARTRSKDNSDAPHFPRTCTRSTASSTTGAVVAVPSVRQRTSSATRSSASVASQPIRRSLSQSENISKSATSSSTGISPMLSRLMRPTEAAKSKMHASTCENSLNKRKASSAYDSKPPKVQKNTIPKSPTFLRRSRTRLTPMKSTEDLVMEKVEQEKRQLRSLRKMNEEGLKHISLSGGRKDKPPTARSNETVNAKRSIYDKMGQTTASSDPNLHAHDYGSSSQGRDVYSKMARMTKPRSPKFLTKLRERPLSVPSAAEREQMELDKIKQAQFKAAPLDKRILEGMTGVKHVQRIPLTEPVSMKFATDKRIAAHASKEKEVEPVQLKVKANPPPKNTTVFQPKLEHKRTHAQPFTFEAKDEDAKRRKAELLSKAEEQERKLREFKANPLPPSPAPIPAKQTLPTTVPEPFHLKIDERGEQQQQKIKRKVEAEKSRMLEAAMIHARPADVLKKVPFVPKKEAAKITEPLNIELSSARRAGERKEYDMRKMEAEAEARALDEELRKRQAAEERKELIRLRQKTIIKPAPIKHYKPVEIKQSDRPLTQPMSPRFSQR
ncbi:targeting protein for Xklp2-like [Watersipora subatra]|uniref:targeting protein for Xklp2-like n=1 Tax=Watersipora subatra TaxID=2589382 RepID=UPI00355B4EAF